jgi:biotin carboxyl carrier protein
VSATRTVHVQLAGRMWRVDVAPAATPEAPPALTVTQGTAAPTTVTVNVLELQPGLLSLLFTPISSEQATQQSVEARLDVAPNGIAVVLNGHRYEFSIEDPRSLRSRRAASGGTEGPRTLNSPMPGRVIRILAPQGTTVEAKQGILVVEAMKMQNELKSPKSGVVSKILVSEGETVAAGQALATIS